MAATAANGGQAMKKKETPPVGGASRKEEQRGTTVAPNQADVTLFFDVLWPPDSQLPEGAAFVLWTLASNAKRAKHTTWCPVAERHRLPELAVELALERVNVYMGAALQDPEAAIDAARTKRRAKDGPDAPRPEPECVRGTNETTAALCGLFADLDVKGPAHTAEDLPSSFDDAREFVRGLPLAPGLLVATGYGLQAWWPFREPLVFETDAERAEAQSLSRRWRGYVSRLAGERGWTLDATDDLARVMRVPGTFNVKLGMNDAPLARIAEYVPERRFNPSEFELYLPTGDSQGTTANEPPPRAVYGPAPIEPVLAGCPWLQHTRDDAATLPEPEWYAMLSIVGRCENGDNLAHEWSRLHHGYTPAETNAKLARALTDAGPVTCSKVAAVTSGRWCAECPSKARGIKSPINLATPLRVSGENDDGMALPRPAMRRLTETGNAERLLDRYGLDIRWSAALGWLTWNERRWARDDRRRVYALAKLTVRGIYGEAERIEAEDDPEDIVKWALKSEKASAREAMVSLVRSEPGVAVGIEELDADPWLLNAKNGTLDLRRGKLRRHERRDLLTKLAPVDYLPDAPAPTWLAFLKRVLPDAEVRAFVQRVIGYALTGIVRDHVLIVFYGVGANGKSTFLEAVRFGLGDYAVQTNPALLMAKNQDTHPTERATLWGRRLAICSETEEGRALAEVMVKQLTGGDTINARYMRMDEFNFTPTHKLILCTNHKPRVRDSGEAMWRRLHLVPFGVVIPEKERDSTLPEKLRAEAPGIFRWAVEGCAEWQRVGLNPPDAVRKATAEYRSDEDTIGQFLKECCHVVPGSDTVRVKAGVLFEAYTTWCDDTGNAPVRQRSFGLTMTERGFGRDKDGVTWYTGVRLTLPGDRTEPETGVL
jgi:P4 family phage/plasmid primase-like protien